MNHTRKLNDLLKAANKSRRLTLLSLVVFTAASASGEETIFGSDNAGYGGFETGVTTIVPTPPPAWTLETMGARFTNGPTTDSGQVNSSLLKEYILSRTDGSSCTVTGVFNIVSAYAADNNRFGISLFATSGDLAGIDTGLSLQLNLGTGNSQNIRVGGVNGTVNFPTAPLSPITNPNFIGQTLSYEALITFSGTDIIVDFTVRAPGLFTGPNNDIPYAQTISLTVPAATYTGNYFGFGTRGRVRNTVVGTNDAPFIYEAKSFSVIDVPAPSSGPFTLSIVPNASTSGNYDFTWTSQAGKLYDLVSSPDLSTAIGTWQVWDGRADLPATPPANMLANVPGGGDTRRFFAVVERAAPALFAENFDSVTALPLGWTRTGPVNGTDWQVGLPSGVPSGPITAFSVPNCAGTNIGGYYTENTNVSLVTPAIAIPADTGATLLFRQLIDTDEFGDAGSVRVLDAGNPDEGNPDVPIAGLEITGLQGFGSEGDGWTENSLVLPALSVGGKNIKIEFNFVSDAGTSQGIDVFGGFYVDDVSVALD